LADSFNVTTDERGTLILLFKVKNGAINSDTIWLYK